MIGRWKLGEQLSTSHSCRGSLDPLRMLETVRRVQDAIDLALLIVGFRELPEIFREFCGSRRPVDDIQLWYSAFSDIEGMDELDLVVNWRGERSRQTCFIPPAAPPCAGRRIPPEIRRMFDHPFDREFGILTACFRQGRLRLVHLARVRVGRGEVRVDEKRAKARIDRRVIFVDRRVEMAEADLCVARDDVKNADSGVARAQPHRPLCIGLRLLEAAERNFGDGARNIERDEIGIDGQSGIGDAKGFAVFVRHQTEIPALCEVSPDIVGSSAIARSAWPSTLAS